MKQARNELIRRQDTHLDAILDRLYEPRVLRIIDAILSGGKGSEEFDFDDEGSVFEL